VKKGSITVESVFIIPIVIYIVCAIIYQTMIVSDRVVAELTAERVLEEAYTLTGDNGDNKISKEIINRTVKEKLSQMLLMHSVENVFYDEKNGDFKIRVEIKPFIHNKASINKKGSDNNGNYCVKHTLKKVKSCTNIRRLDIVKDLSE